MTASVMTDYPDVVTVVLVMSTIFFHLSEAFLKIFLVSVATLVERHVHDVVLIYNTN